MPLDNREDTLGRSISANVTCLAVPFRTAPTSMMSLSSSSSNTELERALRTNVAMITFIAPLGLFCFCFVFVLCCAWVLLWLAIGSSFVRCSCGGRELNDENSPVAEGKITAFLVPFLSSLARISSVAALVENFGPRGDAFNELFGYSPHTPHVHRALFLFSFAT